MNIKRAKEEIKNTIEAYLLKNEFGEYEILPVHQRPIFLLGAPGIGKTQIMEQISKECRIGLVSYTITHHTRQSAIGLPFISEKEYNRVPHKVTEYTMSEIVAAVYDKIEDSGMKEGILFIDEINCVSETLAPAMLQFLQYKTFGSHQIPQGWLIVAAGNPPEYNPSVREFDVVTMDRVKKIQVEPDFAAWKEYAYKEGIHPAVLSYLNLRPASFYKMESTVDGKRFVTPRGWEDLSRLLQVYEKIQKKADREVIVQYLQYPQIARDFANYLELYEKYQADYQIEAVLEGKTEEILLKKLSHAAFDERLSVTGLILSGCSREFEKSCRKKEQLKVLYPILLSCKEVLLGEGKEPPVEFMETVISEYQARWERQKKAELLSRKELHCCLYVTGRLESFLQKMKKEAVTDGAAAFALLKEEFAKEKQEALEAERKAGETLEHAFDFMEAAFLGGQEMVIFLTELNTGFYSLQFLSEYSCKRYEQYNRELLYRENRREILRRIEELQI